MDQEKVGGSLSPLGVVFGVCASACVALNAIYTKRTLPVVAQDIWQLQFYNNFNAVLLFLPLMVVTGELPVLMAFQNLFSLRFMGMCAVAGICGFAIGELLLLSLLLILFFAGESSYRASLESWENETSHGNNCSI